MNDDQKPDNGFNEDMRKLVDELVAKADQVNSTTSKHANVTIGVSDCLAPVRVDDLPLLYIGCRLIPNIVNYLVNILPQFIYPYVVAYLQDLSSLREDPITINELYDYIKSLDNGNIQHSSEAES